ncbi:transcription termination factor MTEF1, chloroplastic isoform X1 [Capsicum annuum]|uniref:transcription termination factor MTEF1, chloroplastic isoform X1 n=1 Tax=Capsicum annuum TaxID=4072 RepID=UPI001FB0E6D2|nr:transcription termination factor MTEF1, chloroplastic isoform X1 [Capsicum annuum]
MQETLHLSCPSPFSLPKSSISPKSFKPSTLSFPQHPIGPKPPTHITPLPTPPPPPPPPPPTPIQEKLLFLDSLGIDSLHCLTSQPLIVSSSLSDIKAIIDFLNSIHLTVLDIRRVLHMCPEILTIPLSTTLRPAVTFLLREVNVTGEKLPGVLRRRPHLLTKCVEKNLRPTLYFLQGSIGIEDVSKCASLLSCDVEGKFIPRLDYFQRIGFARRDAKVMFRRFPSLFCYSIEENLEPKFDYFVVEMGRELKELIEFPQYFSFSLENRIKPRHKMCVEKGVCLSLPVMLKSCESRFRDRLDVCCSSSMPVRQSPFWYRKFDHNVT